MTSKVARSRDQSEPSWPNAVFVSLEAGRGIQLNPAATLLVYIFIHFTDVGHLTVLSQLKNAIHCVQKEKHPLLFSCITLRKSVHLNDKIGNEIVIRTASNNLCS